MTLDLVGDERVQADARRIEGLIKHYSACNTEFLDYPGFAALEKNDLIFIDLGRAEVKSPSTWSPCA